MGGPFYCHYGGQKRATYVLHGSRHVVVSLGLLCQPGFLHQLLAVDHLYGIFQRLGGLNIFVLLPTEARERETEEERERNTETKPKKKPEGRRLVGWLVGRPAEAGSRARQAVQLLLLPRARDNSPLSPFTLAPLLLLRQRRRRRRQQ